MYLDSFLIALKALIKNKTRSLLTVFGVILGIAMVIIVFSAGQGLKGLLLEELISFGDDWIQIEVKIPQTGKTSIQNASGHARGVSITSLTSEDAQAIIDLENIENAYAALTGQAVLSYENEKMRPMIFGVSASFPDIDKGTLAEGRFFSDSEDKGARNVVVLGSEVREALFGNKQALETRIKIDKKTYQVVGIMAERGATGFVNMDRMVYIPLNTAQKKLMGVDHVLWITAKANDNGKAEFTAEEIRALLRERHDISDPDKDDFSVTTMNESLELVGTILNAVTWLLVALACISLLVGGVGIMNVMYVSVVERTFEIGLRKAVGASSRIIQRQFLIESLVITLCGGLLGVFFGSFLSYALAFVARHLGYHWVFEIPLFSILLSTGFSASVGILFGWHPARAASTLEPVLAMRQE
ncbi:MAG: ABC transporter permease [Candidatus Magasanikbacteria bacterium]|nr:ABC transporter permease [Candidatus Magasanikbacteria bacterium]